MEQEKKIRVFYIKSNYFRVVHVDGAHGGITPQGNIFAALYSQRAPIPQTTTHTLGTDGVLKEIEGERTGKEGIIHEVEVGIMMNLPTAESFHNWLGEKIDTLKKIAAKRTEGEK